MEIYLLDNNPSLFFTADNESISHLQTFYLNGISYQPDDFCRCIQRCWILAGQYSFPGMKGYFHDFRKRQNLPDYGWSSFRPSYSSTPIHDKNCFLDG